jgi:hypothetical protein
VSETSEQDPSQPQIPDSLPGEGLLSRDPVAEPVVTKPYSESEDHVPDPTAMTGTLETAGVGGGHHSHLEGVVGVFNRVFHRHPHVVPPEPSPGPVEEQPEPVAAADPTGQEIVPVDEDTPSVDEDPAAGDDGAKTTSKRTTAKRAVAPPNTGKK